MYKYNRQKTKLCKKIIILSINCEFFLNLQVITVSYIKVQTTLFSYGIDFECITVIFEL